MAEGMSGSENASDADLTRAVRAAKERTGYSLAELRELAARDSLPNLSARAAWYALSPLSDLDVVIQQGTLDPGSDFRFSSAQEADRG